jgi:hypothetical protein
MKPALSEKELKASISSSLRRQHLLGAVPGAQRFIPLAAFAIGDVLARGSEKNVIENLLCGSELDQANIPLFEPTKGVATGASLLDSKSTIPELCRTCCSTQIQRRYHYNALSGFSPGQPEAWLKGLQTSAMRYPYQPQIYRSGNSCDSLYAS